MRVNRREWLALAFAAGARAQGLPAPHSKIVYPGDDGRLVYAAESNGDRIPDFSRCGYMGGGVCIPEVPVRAVVEAASEDATERIQRAIDEVSQLDLDETGFRGAVLLSRGHHSVRGTLRIGATGVVLRGEGPMPDGTVIVGAGKTQRTVIEIRGVSAGRTVGSALRVTADYVPVGERWIPVQAGSSVKPGDTVIVRRAGNAAWISEIRMDRITPRPDDPASTVQWTPFNLDFERRVEVVEPNRILIDAPITCAMDTRWGGGQVLPFDESGRLCNVGVENLRGESEFDTSVRRTLSGRSYYADEQHAWSLIGIENANHIWVRNVATRFFGFACVDIGRARFVTVQDCENAEMVSLIDGSRRYTYNVEGQLCLVQRCKSDSGRHDFVVGSRICGPNVFLDGRATTTYATSEPHHRWSVGGLYDNISADIAIQDRQYYGTGHGWAGANYVAWNTEGTLICQKPPTAQNWAIGHVGAKRRGDFEPKDDGYWESLGVHVAPRSLYLQQLVDRCGPEALTNIGA